MLACPGLRELSSEAAVFLLVPFAKCSYGPIFCLPTIDSAKPTSVLIEQLKNCGEFFDRYYVDVAKIQRISGSNLIQVAKIDILACNIAGQYRMVHHHKMIMYTTTVAEDTDVARAVRMDSLRPRPRRRVGS